jgi:hypothetical protein
MDRPAIYLGSSTQQIGADLVSINARMWGGNGMSDLRAYTDCLAAGLALREDLGFARHVRTKTTEEGGVTRADAVYTVSPTLPRGLLTIDAEAMAGACRENGIPLV